MRLAVPRLFVASRRWLLPPPAALVRRASRARFAVLSFGPAFALVLAIAWSTAERVTPEITDTDYHARLQIIRAAETSHPQQPLGLVLGSSRIVWAFRPEQLPEVGVGEVYWVNAAHVGAGPTLNRLILHRLLRDGVRPAVVVLELMPTFFVNENARFVSGHFAASELSLARRYSNKPLSFDYYFLRHRITRATDLARVHDPFAGSVPLLPRGGHPHATLDVTPTERERRTVAAHRNNAEYLRRMTVRPAADRAFRDTLREATDHGVKVVLLRSSEGPTFRSWYNPEGLARFDRYIAEVAAEYRTPILDARFWLDEADFYDSHHVLQCGADKFTTRFAREIPALLATAR